MKLNLWWQIPSTYKRRVFLYDIKDENPLNCIVSKVKIVLVSPNVRVLIYYHGYFLLTCEVHVCQKVYDQIKFSYRLTWFLRRKQSLYDLYYDMKYSLSNLTFVDIVIGNLLLFWTIISIKNNTTMIIILNKIWFLLTYLDCSLR